MTDLAQFSSLDELNRTMGGLSLAEKQNHARFTALLPAKAKILDVECGTGRDTAYLARNGFVVTALEPVKNKAQHARNRNVATVFCNDVLDMAYSRMFDGIWLSNALVHTDYDFQAVKLAHLELAVRENGLMYVCFPKGEGERKPEQDDESQPVCYDHTLQSFQKLITRIQTLGVEESWETQGAVPPQNKAGSYINFILKSTKPLPPVAGI